MLYSMDPSRRRLRHTRRLVLGTLIMLGLFALSLLIFFMDDLLSAFERNYVIHLVMPGATGLADESPVWVSGREVGTVTSVGLLPAGGDTLARVIISVALPVSVQSHVRADSKARLTSIGPISERAIDISAGSAAAPILAPGDTLRHDPQLTATQLADRAAIVRENLNTALADLQAHTPAIRARLQQTERAFAGLDAAMDEAQRLRTDLGANPGLALLQDPGFAASLEGTRAHAAELPIMIGRLRDSAGPAAEVRTALARLQLRADSLSVQLAAAAAALDNPNGTLSRMQQDTALTRALNAARADLDSLSADVRRNPLRYVF
jgi:hypothetical protein